MNTSQTTELPNPQTLTPQDCELISLLEDNRFNLRLLLDPSAPIHPAQRNIISLTRWARQPHINQALDSIVDTHRDLAHKADAHAHLIAKQSLTHALAVAASMIPHFDSCPDDPQQAEAFAKRAETLIRETRLIARTLLKLSPPPASPRSRRGKSTDSAEIDNGIASDATTGNDNSTASTSQESDATPTRDTATRAARSSRLNRNSRKPAFSPAEVAEILSALLDHEADLQSRAARQLNHTNSIPNLNTAPHSITPPAPLSQDTSLPTDSANS